MQSTPVSGGAVLSNVMLIGQAPGPREPVLQRPFAHTARCEIGNLFRSGLSMFSRQNSSRWRSCTGPGRNSQLLFLDG